MLKLDLSNLEGVVSQEQVNALAPEVEAAHAKLYDPAAPGSDFTGWVRLPENYDKDEFARIQKAAARIRQDSQVLVVIGIGGSYLGVRAVIELLKPQSGLDVYFAGNGLSTDALLELLELIGDRDFSVNVISKSGTTTEPAVGFRIFKKLLEENPQWTMKDAVAAAEDLIERGRMCFIPDELEYLRAGGRVNNAVALVGRVLGIHPLIEFLDGNLVATKKLRGKLIKIAPQLVRDYAAEHDLDREELWLIWTPGFPDEVRAAVDAAAKELGFRTVTWIKSGGVITTHAGPSAFGVVGFAHS